MAQRSSVCEPRPTGSGTFTNILVTKPKLTLLKGGKPRPVFRKARIPPVMKRPGEFPEPFPLPSLELPKLIQGPAIIPSVPKTLNKSPSPPPKATNPTTTFQPKARTKNSMRWLSIETFVGKALIPEFGHTKVPIMERIYDCNDDLTLCPFEQSKFLWAGLQKKGVSPQIVDPKDYIDHISRATKALFPRSMDIPLPGEVKSSLDFIMHTDPDALKDFWSLQLSRLKSLGEKAQATQEEWASPPQRILRGGGRVLNR